MIKKNIKRIVENFGTFLNKNIKKRNIVIFNSFPDFSDNSLYLYKYIINHRKDIEKKYKLYWTVNNIESQFQCRNEYSDMFVKKKSLKGLLIFFRAKYIFSTHYYFNNIKSGNGQVQVNLWHGCGFKAINGNEKKDYSGDYTIVTSELYKPIHSNLLNINMVNILDTGLPRNDVLLDKCKCASNKSFVNSCNKQIFWMPTYRKAKFSHDEIDGDENYLGPGNLDSNQLYRMNQILKNINYDLIIKMHPMDAIDVNKLNKYSNIYCLTKEIMNEKNKTLYEYLRDADVLFSDYSSVIVDFLIMNKPIGFILSDYNEYKSNRGFVFNNIKDYMPGPIITKYEELIKYLENIDDINKKYEHERTFIRNKFHTNVDNMASKRICDFFFGINKEEK